MIDILITGGRALLGGRFQEASLSLEEGQIHGLGTIGRASRVEIDARGLLVLPGIVDLHGDAFERQMMPRPGVDFPIDVALIDSDRQAISNGITTVFHATTWSWEPGLRSGDNATRLVEGIELLRPRLLADTRFHLRHEIYNLDAEEQIAAWFDAGWIDLLAFNDHMDNTVALLDNPKKRTRMIERTGLSSEAFDDLVDNVLSRASQVPDSVSRLAQAARDMKVRMLSHDDETPAAREAYRAQGVTIAEFPVNEETARTAAAGNDAIVFGAPNVVRGGSHTGWTNASEMIGKGLCSVLASDYYYPAPLLAPFRLAADGVLPLARAWDLVSAAPARACGLDDRGVLAEAQRADVLVIDDTEPMRPRIVAVIAAGRLAYIGDADRISITGVPHSIAAE